MSSLEEAFGSWGEEPRNDMKKRKKRRAMLPPEPAVIEPDRPAHRPLPAAELLGGGPTENNESTSISEMLNAAESADYFPHPSADLKDENVYRLEPDWAKAFNDDSAPAWIKDRMPQRQAETPLVPSPWLDGANTLWQKIPDSLGKQPRLRDAENASVDRLDDLQKKLDHMFKKLNDLETTRSESNHIEIILFVLGGIFLLLLLDILVKQGTHAAAYIGSVGNNIATTGGMLAFSGGMPYG
jgi:hypothetical protein